MVKSTAILGSTGSIGRQSVAVCEHLGIPAARTVAFGDERNDCSMLRAVGLGVAMGNAVPEARAAADLIAAPNTEDGVAQVLFRLLEESE